MTRFIEWITYTRVSGSAGERWGMVLCFVMNTIASIIGFAGLFGQGGFSPIAPINLVIAIVYCWASWPTLTGTTATEFGKEDDNIRNT